MPHVEREPVTISWNGKPVKGLQGDTVAATLYGQGIRAFTKSRKFHQPRGLSGSFSAGHLASVNGIPHSRLDRVATAQNQCVEMENVWPSAKVDLLNMARLLPRKMIRAGFEHPRFIPDGSFAWKSWEKFLWHMAGEADPPEVNDLDAIPGRRIKADTLIIGGGPAGLAAAQSASGSVVLVTRSRDVGGMAFGRDAASLSLPGTVTVLTDHEVYGLFDNARIAMAAPNNPQEPGVLIEADRVILATGTRSVPPLVAGAALPGVLDARTALHLAARHGVSPGQRVLVIGTRSGQAIAENLSQLGCNIIDFIDVSDVERIEGHGSVSSVRTHGRKIACDAVVHAGPWRSDPSLGFQAGADGDLRLTAGALPDHISLTGACGEPNEAVSFSRALDRRALVCPCMDVTVDEILDLIKLGVTHIEELKRRSTCGMGTCQGVPCWDYLAAVIADATGKCPDDIGHPTYRPTRAALTIGQAAGLADITEVET
ncbi:2Fe-2S iron-sulfur cluster-binding protein [Roseovarius sp. D0-M9]|uniref:2Fe-2S iron-sulfur cluster-binding protein n=1 Tax=Roseovarius sp. D0-M9 TaxID=3127117 RepID=UPI0030103832